MGLESNNLTALSERFIRKAHSGTVHMEEVARSYVWWPKIDENIKVTVHNCLLSYQKVRNPPAVAQLIPWMWPTTPMDQSL